jgi:quinol monooxygenase YgiN
MHLFFRLALGVVIVAAAFASSAHAQTSAVYLATYFDVMPNAIAPGTSLLERYRDASRKEDGNLRFLVLQEIGRPNRFAVVETWRDKAALDTHAKAASTLQFRDKIDAIEDARYDERINNGLYIGQGKGVSGGGTIYVLTHVDVVGSGKDDGMAALKIMSADTAGDPGVISYEVLQQANRGNHFTVVETWANRKALDAHITAPHTRAFREKLMPIAGALYDERLYKALD